ncbi:Uma2 family endonuclease [Nodosilinea sp. LEGE 07088]|uniref:Uma2 family endonuclease n=1 Tax=Nodosilinea sp. LEGE 07088 TaxID=2777968 RepID=UPI0018822AC0|nr:Uma2 family endonuclease [Nodosilinea sp. LEGE 07088]MBE9137564.1 Uma2 family endonuclease [Nodosilinea sp. LEGE 07088]
MTATLIQSPDRVILRNISWQSYQSLVSDFESEPAMRLTYDRGTLEIRMPLDPHETYKKLLGRLIEAATEELGLEIRSLGSRTCDREDLQRGLEPDQCYYIQNEAMVRDVEQSDLAQFPPPDLAVEVDITSSSLDRFSIYADLRVPEVWHYNGQTLTLYQLAEGAYRVCDRSLALPRLKASDMVQLLELRFPKQPSLPAAGENSVVRQFRQWLRSQLEH